MSINATLLAQVFTFALFIWFTTKLIWPRMLSALEARQKTVAEGLAAAERGRQELEAAAKRSNELMAETKQRVQEVIAQADRRAGGSPRPGSRRTRCGRQSSS